MKKCLLIFLLLLSKTALSQLQDDFADDNFTINPVWTGSNAGNDFVISAQQLRSNSLVASTNFYLSTPSSLATHCRWEFWVNLKFATSGANYVDIYLISDTADLQSPEINGYFVRIGNTDDEISLYKRTGTSATNVKLIDGINGSVNSGTNNVIRVRVTRTASGHFKLERDMTGSGTTYFTEGEALDTTVMTSTAFGVFIQQSTSTFFQKHFFDDFKIQALITDTIPPQILSARAIDSLTLAITFSEPVDSVSAVQRSNYNLDPSFPLATIAGTSDPLIYNLILSQNLQPGSYTISADGIRDIEGNVLISRDSATFTYTAPYKGRVGDVVINEIFADPSPQIDLPSVEYIELLNTTNQTIALKNWKYGDATSTYTFQQDSIKSQEHLILCAKADTAEFKKFGRVIGISPWPSLNNAGDSLGLVNEKGILISEVTYTSSWYRNLDKRSGGWSLELLDPFSNCQGITAWTASRDSTGGTPGRMNSTFARLDSVIFRFEEVSILTDSTLQILLNKPLDPNALDKVQFMITPPVGNTVKPELDITLQQLKLTFNDQFAAGTDYSIQSALPDCDDNNWVNISFKTAALPPPLPVRADTATIVINEIFADPSPEIGMPLIEFVEIYNPGKDTINLNGWSLSDSTSKGTIKVGAILPGGFAILCPLADTAQYQRYGNTIGIAPWPALNNSGEKIRLSSFTGRKVDSVAFNDSWYKDGVKKQGGWSLERLDPLSKCYGNTSWTASRNPSGGTPGSINSVFQPNYEQTPWKIDSLQLLSDTSLVFFLNRPIDPSWLQAKAFTLQPAAGNFKPLLNVTQTQLKLTSDEKFTAGTTYTLEFGFTDCNGTQISLTTAFKTPALPPPPPVRPDNGEIIITEIFADPSPEVGLPLAEFIEIFNPGKEPIDLTGWTLSDPTVKSVIKKGLIAPNEYVILCPVADTLHYQIFGKTIGLAPWPSLNNGADQIVLKSFTKRMVDSVAYRDSWYRDSAKVAGGCSLEIINLASTCPGKSNWVASKDPRGGTPGRENSVAGMTGIKEPFQLLQAELKDSVSVLLTFSKPLDSLPAADVSNYQLNNGAGHPQSVLVEDEKVTLIYAAPITRGYTYRATANVSSCGFGPISTDQNYADFFYPSTIRKGDLVINEVLFNPRSKGADFVEIYNISESSFDLKELQLATLDGDSLISIKAVSSVTKLIPPKEYAVFTADPENIKTEYRADRLIGMKSLPGFNDDAGDVVLLSNDQVLDHLSYSEKMHFKLIKDPEGVSLERSSVHRPTNEAGNFRSAAASAGFATPGYQNSQFVHELNSEEEIALTSKTFSPDNDGFEDVLEIRYQFAEPGWVANASVVTDRGAPVKKIARNMTLASEGVITWDGLNDTDQKAPVGIYVLYFEIFNQKGQVKKYRRNFALAARLD